jgi:hypothetical protein
MIKIQFISLTVSQEIKKIVFHKYAEAYIGLEKYTLYWMNISKAN